MHNEWLASMLWQMMGDIGEYVEIKLLKIDRILQSKANKHNFLFQRSSRELPISIIIIIIDYTCLFIQCKGVDYQFGGKFLFIEAMLLFLLYWLLDVIFRSLFLFRCQKYSFISNSSSWWWIPFSSSHFLTLVYYWATFCYTTKEEGQKGDG